MHDTTHKLDERPKNFLPRNSEAVLHNPLASPLTIHTEGIIEDNNYIAVHTNIDGKVSVLYIIYF